MLENVPTRWSLPCPECAELATIELPADAEPGVGIERCRLGHEFFFRYDWSLGVVPGGRNDR